MSCLRQAMEGEKNIWHLRPFKNISLVKRAGGVASLGLAQAWGELESSAVKGRELAQPQRCKAQAGSPCTLRGYWAEATSLFLSGASALCLPFKVPCCLRKHAKYFHEGPAGWKQQEIKAYYRDSPLTKRWGSIWESVFQATCYFYQMFSKAGLVRSIWEVFLLWE